MRIILLLVSLLSLNAYAGPNADGLLSAPKTSLTALLSIRKGAEVPAKELERILRHPEVREYRDVFSGPEKKILKGMKAAYLGRSWILELRGDSSFARIEKSIRRAGLPLALDWNDMKISRQAEAYESLQWGLLNRGLPQNIDLDPMNAYKIAARAGEDVRMPSPVKGTKILVAVLDTGIDKTHPDLKAVIHRNEAECQVLEKFLACVADKDRKSCEETYMNARHDADGNGYPMDCQGWSLLGGVNAADIMGRPDFGDEQGHGTHVAGLIGAAWNGIGVKGISNNVEILPVQVLGDQPSEPLKPLSVDLGPTEENRRQYNRSLGDLVARGVIYAIQSGAKVINFSMGWPQDRDSEFMRMVIAEAQSRGILIVAAAGNDSTRALLRPCAYPGVICVGAHGPDGAPAHFSNYGSGVDLYAPGVNMLSTFPLSKRPIRFRDNLGYEFLSGTSQATPIVAGAAAEMLARGIPASEIYPRLILSSRALQEKLPLLEGMPHQDPRALAKDREPYKKIAIGGNMDLSMALVQSPQTLIIPASKEKQEIVWDRKSRELSLDFKLKNVWQPVSSSAVRVRASFARPDVAAVRPEIVSLTPLTDGDVWNRNGERAYRVVFALTDTSNPGDSRIPSELDLSVEVAVAGQSQARVYNLIYEITTVVDESLPDVEVLPMSGLPKGRLSFLPVDENLDGQPERRDYLAALQTKTTWQLSLVTQAGGGKAYVTKGAVKIKIDGDEDKLREQIVARMDIDGNGKPDYVLGVLEDKSEDGAPSPMSFFIFDGEMNLRESFKYDSKTARIPFTVSWMTVGGRKRPTWVGPGKDPDRTQSLRDRWENPNNTEASELRLYWIDAKNRLRALQEVNGYKIVDIIEASAANKAKGRLKVLLAKNLGSVAKPSYLYSFAVGDAYEGKVENFQELDAYTDSGVYRNLLDTRVDKAYSLDPSGGEFQGSFWFGEGLNRQQKLSLFNHRDSSIVDADLSAIRKQFDSALWVRAAFLGSKRKGAFVLTNSEIQYHDLGSGQTVSTSFERYTFYPDMLMTNLYFPLVLKDSTRSDAKLPALFTTESSGLNRGVKMLVPVFAKDGRLIEVVSPARLRFKSPNGCRPMDTPVFQGAEGHAFDYDCGDKILRVHLRY